jgi:hypothetical protein
LFKILFNTKNSYAWLLFHLLLGFLSTFNKFPLIIWYYVLMASFFIEIISLKAQERDKLIICALIYLSGLELLARMTKTSPLVPYEVSKYLMTFFLLLGIVFKPIKPSKGWWMLLLILPAMFYDFSGEAKGYMPIVFNLFGPIDIALAIVYFSQIRIDNEDLKKYMRLLFWVLVAPLLFTILKTPSYDEIEFKLSANFSTTGGFGSNQVSSALGLGFFVMFMAWFQNWKLSGSKLLDAFFMIVFLFQAIMTFSRGGVIGGVLAIVVVLLLILANKSKKVNTKNLFLVKYVVLISIGGYFIFTIADGITGGMITNRYKGETAGTLLGTKEQTFNNITSNRYDIFIGDLELWAQNPILGIGVGASRHLRTRVNDVIAHVEMSRLLAEHGIMGLVYFLLLISVGLANLHRSNKVQNLNMYFLFGLFVLAFFTTFHAATRTFITPLLIGISCVRLGSNDRFKQTIKLDEKNIIYRQFFR